MKISEIMSLLGSMKILRVYNNMEEGEDRKAEWKQSQDYYCYFLLIWNVT